jgi:hypothetical protein
MERKASWTDGALHNICSQLELKSWQHLSTELNKDLSSPGKWFRHRSSLLKKKRHDGLKSAMKDQQSAD